MLKLQQSTFVPFPPLLTYFYSCICARTDELAENSIDLRFITFPHQCEHTHTGFPQSSFSMSCSLFLSAHFYALCAKWNATDLVDFTPLCKHACERSFLCVWSPVCCSSPHPGCVRLCLTPGFSH